MNKKKDIVVGVISNYTFDDIKCWVNSLDSSGFDGEKIMICYNIDYDTVDELKNRNYNVITYKQNDITRRYEYKDYFSVVVDRFLSMYLLFSKYNRDEYRYIISCDVGDVIFQKNPIEWLEKNIGEHKINVASESMIYEDENWGRHNLYSSFGSDIYEINKKNTIYNAGIISGSFDYMVDLFLQIYLICNGTSHFSDGGGGPDQAALNILLNLAQFKNITKYNNSESGYCAQLGTTGEHIQTLYGGKLIEKSPIVINDMVCTSNGYPFYIVHQYNRIQKLKEIIENKYKNK